MFCRYDYIKLLLTFLQYHFDLDQFAFPSLGSEPKSFSQWSHTWLNCLKVKERLVHRAKSILESSLIKNVRKFFLSLPNKVSFWYTWNVANFQTNIRFSSSAFIKDGINNQSKHCHHKWIQISSNYSNSIPKFSHRPFGFWPKNSKYDEKVSISLLILGLPKGLQNGR